MKIGLVLASAPGYSETFFKSKIAGLKTSGHKVVLFCTINPHHFDSCSVVLLPKQYKNRFRQLVVLISTYIGLLQHLKIVLRFIGLERQDGVSWSQILKRLYSYGPIFKHDLDWLHFGFGTLALGAENLALAKEIKMAVSFRGFDIGVYPIKYPNCYKRLWDKVSKVHVISDDIASLVLKHGFQGQAPIVKITPAIDTHHFSSNKQAPLGECLKIVTVARLHWKKGLDYTLEALFLLKQAGVDFEYRIIGTGPEEEALKFASYQLGLQEQVLFLGKLKHGDIKRELEAAQIYVQYSVQEGFCNSVLEAQAMGLLTVVSDAEGLAENVVHDITGFVVPKRKPRELANTIEKLLYLPSKRKIVIRKAAVDRVQREFNLVKQQKEFVDFYTH